MLRIQKLSLAFGSILILCSLPVWAGGPGAAGAARVTATARMPAQQVQQRLDELFYRWETYELDLPAVERQVRETGRVTLHAGGRVLDLELELNDLRAPGFKSIRETRFGPVEESPAPVATFKGHVAGDAESVVRLLILPDRLEGYIRTGGEWIFLDPLRKYARSAASSEIVLFEGADVRPEAAALCGSGELTRRAQRLIAQEISGDLGAIPEKALIAPPALRQVDVAIEADYDYYLLYGAGTQSHIEGVINSVDGIYRGELALTLSIVWRKVWEVDDPYTSTDDAGLIGELQNYWNDIRRNEATTRDLAYLFTGRDTGVTQGRAFSNGVICNRDSSYAYSRNHPLEIKLVAHEMGHLFNSIHDDQPGFPLAATCGGPLPPPNSSSCAGTGPIMCGCMQSGGPSSFSDRSKTLITAYVNSNGSCLASVPMTAYTILTNQTPQTQGAGTGYEAGNQFSSSQDGYITALRFWKASGETGAHTGNLWTDSNRSQPLASVTFQNETSSGWQEAYLPFRVKVTAGTLYWVTYNENAWQAKTGCGISPPITNGPLTAWGSAYSDANSAGIFPIHGSCSNFFADVYFTP